MIGRRMANIIKRLARHRDDMRLANFQRVSGLDAEWKLLRCPTEYCLPNLWRVGKHFRGFLPSELITRAGEMR